MSKETKNQKLSQEELSTVKSLQEKRQRVTLTLGSIEIAKNDLKSQRESAEQDLYIIIKQEKELIQSLEQNYGRGSVDISTGEFIPA